MSDEDVASIIVFLRSLKAVHNEVPPTKLIFPVRYLIRSVPLPLPGMDFAGGFILEGPWGRVASANITSDPSGIPYYDEALFQQVMRTGYVKARKLNEIMAWSVYQGMTDDDLAAIFAYLRTLKPAAHRVDNTEPPTYCPLCKSTHGAGHQNHAS